MPVFKNVEVQVLDGEGEALPEYGQQKICRAGIASCYIQSKDNEPFQISLRPTACPFPALKRDRDARRLRLERLLDEASGPMFSTDDSYSIASQPSEHSCVDDTCRDHAPAPWHLLATLRLDGRSSHEKRAIITLDQAHDKLECHDENANRTFIRRRRFRGADGKLREGGWFFKEVGIVTLMQTMQVEADGRHADDEEELQTKGEDRLCSALNKLQGDLVHTEKQGVGQIEITLERVTISRRIQQSDWYAEAKMSKKSGYDGKDITKASHTAQRDEGTVIPPLVNIQYYDTLDPENKPFAKFKFYYRSEKCLRKFGFLNDPVANAGVLAPSRARRRMELAMGQAASSFPAPATKRSSSDAEATSSPADSPSSNAASPPAEQSPSTDDSKQRFTKRLRPETGTSIDADSSDDESTSIDREDDDDTTSSPKVKEAQSDGSPASSPPTEAEQSSADDSSPLAKRPAKTSGRLDPFRHIRPVLRVEDESNEADDEASDANRTRFQEEKAAAGGCEESPYTTSALNGSAAHQQLFPREASQVAQSVAQWVRLTYDPRKACFHRNAEPATDSLLQTRANSDSGLCSNYDFDASMEMSQI